MQKIYNLNMKDIRNKITDKLISLFNLDKGDKIKNYGYFEGILSIVVNIILFLMKFIFGTVLNSIALIADSYHTLSDVLTSVLVVVGFKISAKPPDEKHPFGHGRVERVFAIAIAAILIIVGIEFFANSYKRLINPISIKADLLIILLLIFSVFVKEFLTAVSYILGIRINSASLKADAWHHRSDAIATAIVVAGFIAFRFGLFRLDGILGMGISVLIAYTGYSIIREASSMLMGEAPPSALVKKIEEIALCCDGVTNVHHIHVHDYGGIIEITVHIRLKRDTHLDDAHEKASGVEKALRENIQRAEVTVHVEPEFEKPDTKF